MEASESQRPSRLFIAFALVLKMPRPRTPSPSAPGLSQFGVTFVSFHLTWRRVRVQVPFSSCTFKSEQDWQLSEPPALPLTVWGPLMPELELKGPPCARVPGPTLESSVRPHSSPRDISLPICWEILSPVCVWERATLGVSQGQVTCSSMAEQ